LSYIGRGTESISNVEVLDNLTFDGSASYTLQKSSVNFVPSSANNLLISISGVVQQGNFSVSGSTITFDTTVSGSDTCDWILHYGTGLITTVADGAITEAKLGSNAVTTAKINNGAITSAKLDSGLALGKIGQVFHTTTTTQLALTTSGFVDVGLQQVITPSSTSSNILIFVNLHSQYQDSGQNAAYTMKMLRGATQVYTGGQLYEIVSETTNASGQHKDSWTFLDSPLSTSALTYKVQVSTFNNSDVTFQRGGFFQSELLVMEVLA
jgi:hypothetical protein